MVDRLLASPRLWRALGAALARPGAVRRDRRLRARPGAPQRLALSRLGDRRLEPRLPFDEFVRQQIAGDVLRPDDPQAAIATGFLLCGPDMPDLNLQEERRHVVLNEMTATVGSGVSGPAIRAAPSATTTSTIRSASTTFTGCGRSSSLPTFSATIRCRRRRNWRRGKPPKMPSIPNSSVPKSGDASWKSRAAIDSATRTPTCSPRPRSCWPNCPTSSEAEHAELVKRLESAAQVARAAARAGCRRRETRRPISIFAAIFASRAREWNPAFLACCSTSSSLAEDPRRPAPRSPGTLADESRQPADRAGHRQSPLAMAFRRGAVRPAPATLA